MSASPPGEEGRGGARRILSSVSEVAAELSRLVTAEPAEIYQVARQVVAEELGRVKQGFESAPLGILVERAERRLRASRPAPPRAAQPDLFAEAPPAAHPEEPPMPVLPAPYEAREEPFAPASSVELGWDRVPGGEAPPPVGPAGLSSVPAELEDDASTLPVEPVTSREAAEIPIREEGEERSPAPASTRRRVWIAAVAALVLVAAGLGWLVVRFLAAGAGVMRSEAPKAVEVPAPPAPSPEPAPAPAPVRIAEAKAPAAKAAPAGRPAAAPRRERPADVPKVASFATKDWKGRPPVYVLHFSSQRERADAAGEATRLAAAFRKPGHVVEVDLGPKGIWYRVVIGEFATAEEAKAFRGDLAAKNTPGMGHVYLMKGAP